VRAVNLIPAESRAGGGSVTGRSQGAALIVLGLMVGLIIIAGLYGLARHQVSQRRAEAAKLTAQAQAAEAQASSLIPYSNFIALRDQRMQAVAQLVGTRFDWAHVMHELGRVLPHDVALSSVQGSVTATGTSAVPAPTPASPPAASAATPASAASAVQSATPAGSTPTVAITGCTTSQSEVARTLQRLRLMDGVRTVALQSSTRTGESAGVSSASGRCPSGDAVFIAQVSFSALPTPAAPNPQSTVSASTSAAKPGGGNQ
jgi:Tfp pilus assembly protein PilN